MGTRARDRGRGVRVLGRRRGLEDLQGDEPLAVAGGRVVEQPAREVAGVRVLADGEPGARGDERRLVEAVVLLDQFREGLRHASRHRVATKESRPGAQVAHPRRAAGGLLEPLELLVDALELAPRESLLERAHVRLGERAEGHRLEGERALEVGEVGPRLRGRIARRSLANPRQERAAQQPVARRLHVAGVCEGLEARECPFHERGKLEDHALMRALSRPGGFASHAAVARCKVVPRPTLGKRRAQVECLAATPTTPGPERTGKSNT